MTYALSLATLPATSIENGCVAASNEIAEPKKCTRVGDREFPDGKSLGRNCVILVVIRRE